MYTPVCISTGWVNDFTHVPVHVQYGGSVGNLIIALITVLRLHIQCMHRHLFMYMHVYVHIVECVHVLSNIHLLHAL